MGGETHQSADTIKQQFVTHLAPFAGKVTYGNLRHDIREWQDVDKLVINFAIVYETPGGSTNQLNVVFNEQEGSFTMVHGEEQGETTTNDFDKVMGSLTQVIRTIPERRLQKLRSDIETWFAEGKSRADLLTEINKLVTNDFKGGAISHMELKDAVQYCLTLFASSSSSSE